MEDMDDLQKLSVYMHYFITRLTKSYKKSITFAWTPYEILKHYQRTGIMIVQSPTVSIHLLDPYTFDEFKESHLSEYYERFKNEITLV